MKKFLLTKVRLSTYFVVFLIFYFLLLFVLPRYQFDGGILALFSVNSFLFGFYVSPILRFQKQRIDKLNKAVRAEANAIFAMMMMAKNMPEKIKDEFKAHLVTYLNLNAARKYNDAEIAYESLISYVVDYRGKSKDEVDELVEMVIDNQENRTDYRMEVANKIYSNEWMVMMVLFFITLIFVLLMDTGSSIVIQLITALLCTGLTMLILILVKLDSMTHKKAKGALQPYMTLVETNFYHIDKPTVEHEKH